MSAKTKPDPASVGGRTEPDPFAGIANADGEPIADENANPDAAFRVVWIGPDAKTIVVGTADDADEADRIFNMTDPGKGRVFLFEAGDEHPLETKGEIVDPKRANEETTEPARKLEEPAPAETELEKTVREEQEAHEAEARALHAVPDEDEETVAEAAERARKAVEAAQPDPEKGALFDASDYEREDLALPAIDGHPIDRIAVKFSGEVMLDRSNPDHVALWKRLKIGKTTELWIETKGTGFGGKGATNRAGDLDVVVGTRSVSVESVRILAPEELEDAAREMVAQAREAADLETDVAAAAAADGDETDA